MRFRTLTTMMAAGALLFTFGIGDAQAKKKDKGEKAETEMVEISETGTSADEIFMAAKEIHDSLNTIQTNLAEGTAELNSALGLTEGTPLADALADLQSKAGDKLTVALEGTMPKFSLADGAPENVTNAVNSLNSFVDYHVKAIDEAKAMAPKAQEVAAKAQGLDYPALAGEVASNPMEIGKVLKTLKNNGQAVTQTPKRVQDTVTVLGGNIEVVTAVAK